MQPRPNWLSRCLLPDWALNCDPDETHFYRRCFTRRHRAKRRVVRDVWLGTGCMMFLHPVLPFILTLGLATILLSFVVLDETD